MDEEEIDDCLGVVFEGDVPSASLQGEVPTGAGAPLAKPRRKPRVGEALEKYKARLKRYRERCNGRVPERLAAMDATRVEIAALRLEQTELLQENRALETMKSYSESLFETLRTFTYDLGCHGIASVAQGSLVALLTYLREKLLARSVAPTDGELRMLAFMATEGMIRGQFVPFFTRLSNFVVDWCLVPSKREEIESQVESHLDTRFRFFILLHEVKPSLAMSVRDIVRGVAREVPLSTIMPFLQHPDMLAARRLSDRQTRELLSCWKEYKLRYHEAMEYVLRGTKSLSAVLEGRTRLMIITASHGQENAGASEDSGHFIATEPLSRTAERHLSCGTAAAILEEFSKAEVRARKELSMGAVKVLTPMQKAHIFISSLPDRDVFLIYRALVNLEGTENDFEFAIPAPLKMALQERIS
jgi:hypothetical protein